MLRLLIISILFFTYGISEKFLVEKVDRFNYMVNDQKFNISEKKELKQFQIELIKVKKLLVSYEKAPQKNFLFLNDNYLHLTEALKFSQNRKLRYDSYKYHKRHISLLENHKDFKMKKNQSFLVSTYSALADTIMMLHLGKKLDEAEFYQNKALNIIKKNPGIVNLSDESFCNMVMSDIYFEKYYREKMRRGGVKEKSFEFIKKGLVHLEKTKNIYEMILEKNDFNLATTYQQIAIMNKELASYKSLKKAKKYQKKAVNIYTKILSKKNKIYIDSIKNLRYIDNMLKKIQKV